MIFTSVGHTFRVSVELFSKAAVANLLDLVDYQWPADHRLVTAVLKYLTWMVWGIGYQIRTAKSDLVVCLIQIFTANYNHLFMKNFTTKF